MAKKVTCSKCKNVRWMRYDVFKRYLTRLNITNIKELNQVYMCGQCRQMYLKKKPQKRQYRNIIDFDYLQKELQQQVDLHIQRGVDDKNSQINFINNVKEILARKYITCYSFVIKGRELEGILLKNITFIGDYFMQLKGKK